MRWRAVATEVGGLAKNFRKINQSFCGQHERQCDQKKGAEMHALMHASMEAINSFLPLCLLEASAGAKLMIVRSKDGLALL